MRRGPSSDGQPVTGRLVESPEAPAVRAERINRTWPATVSQGEADVSQGECHVVGDEVGVDGDRCC